MANRMLKRYGLEHIAKILIVIGFLLVLLSWIEGFYYYGITATSKIALFIVPLIFTCIFVVFLLVIKYRYALFEKYPYLVNLPSIFYRIGGGKRGLDNQSKAFSMIYTVHALVIAFLGLLSVVLTFSIGSSINRNTASPFLYVYLAIVAVLVVSVFLQYRRIYIKFAK